MQKATTAEELKSMDREAAVMIARMEATNAEACVQIIDDMRRLMASNPDARLADWAARSEWARDTDGPTDEEGSALRAQGRAWQQLWEAAAELAASRGEAGNSVGAGEGSTFTSGTKVRVPALSAGEAIGTGSKPANEGSAAQFPTTMPATSSSAVWLAQRHMNALMRGTSVGSTVRIAVG
eukprot:COSAG02_NODE_1258_length_13569_cov_5.275650_2_plen_181_part_00